MTRFARSKIYLLFAGVVVCFSIPTMLTVIQQYSKGNADDVEELSPEDIERYAMRAFEGKGKALNMTHTHGHDDLEAKELYKKVRVLCWIMTSPKNLEKKATAVKNTWASRCNKYIFFSSETNSSFPTIGLNVSEGREHLTAKTMKAFAYCYAYHLNDFDWFIKADDDSFVIVENLRYFLSHYSSTDPVYFGHKFKQIVPGGYMSGGGGYVLSRETLKRFIERGVQKKLCKADGGAEDVEIGKCLHTIGITAANSTDIYGRDTFHPFKPISHLEGTYPDWFYQYSATKIRKGLDCCSDYSITFHYLSPSDIYTLDYLLYHLRPHGTNSHNEKSRVFPSLKEQNIDVT